MSGKPELQGAVSALCTYLITPGLRLLAQLGLGAGCAP